MSVFQENTSGTAARGTPEPDTVLIPLIEAFRPHVRRAQLPCYMMDPVQQHRGFFGREDVLKSLDDTLLPSEDLLVSSEPQPLRYAVLHGMPGVGKTETAIQFMFTRKLRYQAVFWVRAESTTKLESDFAKIGRLLGPENSAEPQNEVDSRELAKAWLLNPRGILDDELDSSSQTEVPWLLIFDNADDPSILMDYTHLFGSGSVLVTSRYPLTEARDDGRQLSPKTSIPLATLDVEEAARFLRELTPRYGTVEESLLIAKKLGGLPLAIIQMVGFIRSEHLSYTDFLARYEDLNERAELHAWAPEGARPTARGTIRKVFAVEKLNGHPRLVLDILSLLDPDEIPEHVLDGLFQAPTTGSRGRLTRSEFQSARGELLSRSLIKRNVDEKKLWIHRLIQDAVRAQMSPERRQEVGTITVALLTAAWPTLQLDQKHKIERWTLYGALCPHILSVRTLEEKSFVPLDANAELDLATLLIGAGW